MERVALLAHLPLFHECRAGLLRVAESALDGSAAALDYAAAPGDLRQRGLDGSPADLDALYAAADAAAAPFAAALERCGDGLRPRAEAAARQGESGLRDAALDAADACGGPARGVVRTDWAGLLQDRGDDDGALEAYRAALDVYVETFGAGDKLCATPLANLARALANVGDYVAAVDRYAACLAIRERVFGPDHGSALAALAALGRARRLAGDAAGADCALRGVALRTPAPLAGDAAGAEAALRAAAAQAPLGPRHPRVRTLFANLAHVLLSSDAPGVEDALNDLGETLRAAGLYEAAEPVYRRSVAVCEKRRGRDSLEVTPKLNNLALLLQHMGRHGDEAEALSAPALARCLTIHERVFGPDHIDVAAPLNNLAILLQARGCVQINQRAATGREPKIRRSLALVEARFGADHGHAATLRATSRRSSRTSADADRDTPDDDSDGSGGGSAGGAAAEAASRAAPTPPNSPSDAAEEVASCAAPTPPTARATPGAAARHLEPLEAPRGGRTRSGARRRGRPSTRRPSSSSRGARRRCWPPSGSGRRDAKTAATTLAADVARLEREKAELEIRCKDAELSPKVVKMQKRNEQLGARPDLAEALEASTLEREDLAARVDGAAAAAAAAAASAAASPAAEAPSDAGRRARWAEAEPAPDDALAARPPLRGGLRRDAGRRPAGRRRLRRPRRPEAHGLRRARRLAAAARRDADAAAGDIASWLARESRAATRRRSAANRASFAEDLARAADRCDRAEAHAASTGPARSDRAAASRRARRVAPGLAEHRPRAGARSTSTATARASSVAGAADYDAFANDTPVRTYDLSNARGGDDDGPMSDAEEASYQDALLGICMDLPMLRGRKASS
ncbi:hypothetical protein JL721_3513 [Aureococcus anophagefferens]|nr:hypothetical protein JL721_3513 [Aureococcus anophagefferens]